MRSRPGNRPSRTLRYSTLALSFALSSVMSVGVAQTSQAAVSASALSWYAQSSGTRARLDCVSFANARVGWAGGTAGTILRTTDGGATWKKQLSSTSRDIIWIQGVDADHAWAMDWRVTQWSPCRLLGTTDGGKTWRVLSTPKGINRSDWAQFVSPTKGYLTAGYANLKEALARKPTRLYVTSNGGTTWRALALNGFKGGEAHDFVGTGTYGWSGPGPSILRTGNAGRSWSAQRNPAVVSSKNAGVNALYWIEAFDKDTAWAQVGWGSSARIIGTTNGGTTWRLLTRGWRHKPDFVSRKMGWCLANLEGARTIATAGGDVLSTTDGGKTWSVKKLRGMPELLALDFVSSDNGWAVGQNGTIYHYGTKPAPPPIPPDTTPPAPVDSFSAVDLDTGGPIELSWVNPASDFAAVRILASATNGYATGPNDASTAGSGQRLVYEGSAQTCVDLAATAEVEWVYTTFARDAAGNWSERAVAFGMSASN